jgi:hypothetical protein
MLLIRGAIPGWQIVILDFIARAGRSQGRFDDEKMRGLSCNHIPIFTVSLPT